MKVLSLFSGVGGFDYGLENAGMETVFQCEWDKHANSILYKHWPDVPKWDDVSTLTGKHILAHAPVIDVVAWGSPCQDLSVAGARKGLDGERSGLFHEGIRIIKELQEETNGQYPRISIWENVVGALNSNRGADFGIILDQMAEAGAVAIEWSVLDAQYFGIPQRRRRVFVIAIFDPVLAERCPNPLLPVSESLPGHLTKGKPKGKSAARTLTEGLGTDGAKPIEGYTPSSFANYTEGVGTLRSNGGDLGGGSETLVTEPFVKSSRAQTSEDSETWIQGEVNPTLNSFDVGDTRATTAIVEPMLIDGTRVNDVRVYESPVQTLKERMGTGGNNVPMLAFDTQFGSNANVTEDIAPTLKASQQSPSVAYPIDTRNALRDPEKYDAQNRQGLGIGADGDPMATLTSAHVNAVAYDEYNDSTNEVHHALRAGTKQSTGVLMFQDSEFGVKEYDTAGTLRAGRIPEHQMIGEVAATLRSGGDGGVPSSRGEHLVTEPTMAVRRLTPLECERLQGWPDDHTRYKADGTEQADTHRYKQCGNGVASPVAQWIAKHILAI
jgi:DNA (cytosine-5)-methyltransferase 1